MGVSLISALSQHPELGLHYENLGKSRFYLAYDSQNGWKVEDLNPFFRIIRYLFNCFFKATHLSNVLHALSLESDIPEDLRNRMQEIWRNNYPTSSLPLFLENPSFEETEVVVFPEFTYPSASQVGKIGTDSHFAFHDHLADGEGRKLTISSDDFYFPIPKIKKVGSEDYLLKTEKGNPLEYLPSSLLADCEDNDLLIFQWRGQVFKFQLPSNFKNIFSFVKEKVDHGQVLFIDDQPPGMPKVEGYQLSKNAQIFNLKGHDSALGLKGPTELWIEPPYHYYSQTLTFNKSSENNRHCFSCDLPGRYMEGNIQFIFDHGRLFVRAARVLDPATPLGLLAEDQKEAQHLNQSACFTGNPVRLIDALLEKYIELAGKLPMRTLQDGRYTFWMQHELNSTRIDILKKYAESISGVKIDHFNSINHLFIQLGLPSLESSSHGIPIQRYFGIIKDPLLSTADLNNVEVILENGQLFIYI